jgi:hypothetical protein
LFERWLSEHCIGAWEVRLEDVLDDLGAKVCVFYFEEPNDLEAFKRVLGQRKAPERFQPPASRQRPYYG